MVNNRYMDDIFEVVKSGNLNRLKELLANGGYSNAQDSQGRTLLHLAAKYNDTPEIAQALLAHGTKDNVNSVDDFDQTPLHLANTPEIAQVLLANGAIIDKQETYGYTPLHYAARNEKMAVFLIDNQANLSVRNILGNSPLDDLDYSNSKPIREALIRRYKKQTKKASWHPRYYGYKKMQQNIEEQQQSQPNSLVAGISKGLGGTNNMEAMKVSRNKQNISKKRSISKRDDEKITAKPTKKQKKGGPRI